MLARDHVAVLVSTFWHAPEPRRDGLLPRPWNISTVEWRLLMTLNSIESLNVSELSDAADIDKAAASRSLALSPGAEARFS